MVRWGLHSAIMVAPAHCRRLCHVWRRRHAVPRTCSGGRTLRRVKKVHGGQIGPSPAGAPQKMRQPIARPLATAQLAWCGRCAQQPYSSRGDVALCRSTRQDRGVARAGGGSWAGDPGPRGDGGGEGREAVNQATIACHCSRVWGGRRWSSKSSRGRWRRPRRGRRGRRGRKRRGGRRRKRGRRRGEGGRGGGGGGGEGGVSGPEARKLI